MLVVGVDGYRERWIAVVLDDGRFVEAELFPTLGALLGGHAEAAAIGVDIPIGLLARGVRAADGAARAFVGPRWSSVFLTPPRPALAAESYPEASTLYRSLNAAGMAKQAYALRAKILEADALARRGDRVFEVHPEVSFRAMAGGPLPFGKKTWNGLMQRIALLRAAGIEIPLQLAAGVAAPDDVVDAAAVAWSADRVARGRAERLPADLSETDPRSGREIAIWY
jgi:predicted RNase H-like nuclease